MVLTVLVTLLFIGYGFAKYHQYRKTQYYYPQDSKMIGELMANSQLSNMVSKRL